jgi:AraC-like DNA-binding protein
MGRIDQATVAREMAISVASLRRRLADEGHRFRDLDREVRQALARDGIVAGRRTEDIASDLGYSEARSLRRAANRWFGKPPTGLRQPPPD